MDQVRTTQAAEPSLSWEALEPTAKGVLTLASLFGPFEGNAAAARELREQSALLESTRGLNQTALTKEYRRLRELGWMRAVGQHGSRVHPKVAHRALMLVPRALFEQVLRDGRRNYYGYGSPYLAVRAALYLGEVKAFAQAAERVQAFQSKEALWLGALELHEVPSRIGLLPEAHRIEATSIAFGVACSDLTTDRDEWRELLLALPPSADRSSALLSLGTLDALASDRIAAEALFDVIRPEDAPTLRAALAFSRFELEETRSELVLSVDAARSGKKRKKLRLEGPLADIFYALLATGDAMQKQAAAELASAFSKRKLAASYTARALSSWANQLPIEGPPTVQGQDLLDSFCNLLMVFWAAEIGILSMTPAGIQWAEEFVPFLERRGYRFLSDALEKGRAALRPRSAPSWLQASVRRAEAWEIALEQLESLAARGSAEGPKAEEPGGEERLYWRVEAVRHGYVEVSPRLRKSHRHGEQKGRAVALKRLSSLDRKIVDEHDAPAIACVRATAGFYGSEYSLSDKISLALVGHPRVLDENDQPLRVVQKSLELSVEDRPKGYRVRVEPAKCERTGPYAVKSGSELRVYSIRDDDLALLRRFSDEKLVFPASTRQRLGGLLAKLSGKVEVHSGLDEHEVNETGDARPTVVLDREHPGLRVTIGVRPLGASGPLLVPGAGVSVVRDVSSGVGRRVRRDLGEELRLLSEAWELSPILASLGQLGEPERLSELEQCYELILSLTELGERVRIEWREGTPLKVPLGVRAEMVKVAIGVSPNWLSATLEVEPNPGELVAMQELLSSLARSKGRFVELSSGDVLALSSDLRAKLETLAAAGVPDKSGALGFHPLAAPALEALTADFSLQDPESAFSRLAARSRQASDAGARVPRSLQADLRDYQRIGFRWMKRLLDAGGGAILADDMGLGKTLQILAVLLTLRTEGPMLIVAPKSLLGHWCSQIQIFAPSLKARVYTSEERELEGESLSAGEVLVASYGLVQRHIERLKTVEFRAIVLDEAQAIKNADSLRAKAMHALRATARIVATGTPIENHLGELWSLMHFANPGLLGGRETFERRFTDKIRSGDRAAATALRRLVAPFLLRRTKAEVLSELPAKTEVTLTVEPSVSEVAFYEALRQKAVGEVEQGGTPGVRRVRLLAALTRLRQAACHPVLAGGPTDLQSSKHETLFALLDDLRQGSHRSLIFSQFVEHLKLVQGGLEERGITFEFLDGSKSTRAREEAVHRFQGGEAEVFLISLRAGGFGLNLTAADYVIHLDPWWNPAVEAQATDRAHRIGQERPVTVYRLVTKGTVEERILSLHGEKRATAELLLDGADQATPLDLEVLRGLLEP